MEQTTNVAQVDNISLAKQDANSEFKAVQLPSFGGAKIAAAVVFLQNRVKKIYETYYMKEDEVKTEKKVIDGKEKIIPVYENKTVTVKGKTLIHKVPVLTGNKVERKVRIEVDSNTNPATKSVLFECSNVNDMRRKIGEAFTVMERAIEDNKHNFAKSQPLHINVKIGKTVFSTTILPDGGVKLSKLFSKGQYQKQLFASEFCRPLFNQLKSIEQNENGKPLSIPDAVLKELGLSK